ncbi:EI24 domain-containing protein [Arcobacter sp. KX21116]|uniref:EI24 domain-containing protein n=1 Tax=Arcobacter iocasae TaxID=2906515 RepID=UPI0035D45A77
MNEVELIKRSLKDFFTPGILKIAIIPLLVTVVVMILIFMGFADYSLSSLDQVIIQVQNGEEFTVDPNAPFFYVWAVNVLTFLLHYSVTAWLAGFLLFTVGTFFILFFSIFTTLIIIGFLTPMIIETLRKRHYPDLILKGHGSLISPLWVAFKSLVVMMLLFILFIPLYFIPLVNIIAFNLPIYYFFHKLLNFDVTSTMLSSREYFEIYTSKKNLFRFRTLLLYFMSMIPFIALFSAVFFIVYLSNGYFLELKEIRKTGLDI